jgi:hypothetical protein
METDYVIETYELERKAYAVFSGVEGEDPFLVAPLPGDSLPNDPTNDGDPLAVEDTRYL